MGDAAGAGDATHDTATRARRALCPGLIQPPARRPPYDCCILSIRLPSPILKGSQEARIIQVFCVLWSFNRAKGMLIVSMVIVGE